jgi:hypothetical protein
MRDNGSRCAAIDLLLTAAESDVDDIIEHLLDGTPGVARAGLPPVPA